MMLEVVNYIYSDLQKQGIGVVKIVGGDNERMDKINSFKYSDNIDVLIATSQTLSTGVTLTEADQMFFFGTPWRSADYQQAHPIRGAGSHKRQCRWVAHPPRLRGEGRWILLPRLWNHHVDCIALHHQSNLELWSV